MIEPSWETERLHIRDALSEDASALQEILESIQETLWLEGKNEIAPDEMEHWISEGSLPPGGIRARFRLQTIIEKRSGAHLGYLALYHGYPDSDTLYINSLTIVRDRQAHGFGSELVDALGNLPSCKEYRSFRLWVALKNWTAVRFWVRHGFTQIVQFTGDKKFGDESSAGLELEKRIPE